MEENMILTQPLNWIKDFKKQKKYTFSEFSFSFSHLKTHHYMFSHDFIVWKMNF
jgi:hypothetical protein